MLIPGHKWDCPLMGHYRLPTENPSSSLKVKPHMGRSKFRRAFGLLTDHKLSPVVTLHAISTTLVVPAPPLIRKVTRSIS